MLKIDVWYKDEKIARYDCFFYPNDGIYRGNLFNRDGKVIGDYWCNDSVELENRMKYWNKN